jgi:electron transport complex protein RnfG
MATREDSFKNMTITLLAITAVAAVMLGFVYKFTKDPIAQVKKDNLKKSINLVIPGADKGTINEVSVLPAEGGDTLFFYEVIVNDLRIGTAIKTYTDKAFSGRFTVMVGFDTVGNIIDNNVLDHKETPGLGDKTSKSKSPWNEQFKGKNPGQFKLKVKKDGGDVDAITAATISSRAYCDALQRAFDAYVVYYKLNTDTVPSTDQEKGGTE